METVETLLKAGRPKKYPYAELEINQYFDIKKKDRYTISSSANVWGAKQTPARIFEWGNGENGFFVKRVK